jgi:septal ring factor EnvC (AmiA/AmiB activator)
MGEPVGWIQTGTVVVPALGMLGAVLYWALGRVLGEKVAELKIEIRQRAEEDMRNYGETAAAIRQKISDVELWNRDTFVRRDEFKTSLDQVNRNIESLRTNLDEKIDRLDTKLDTKLDKLINAMNRQGKD